MKWNSMDELGIYLYESKHDDGDVVDIHQHSFYQVLYALDGEGTIVIDKDRYPFCPDRAAVIAPHTDHAVLSEAHLTLIVLVFDMGYLHSISESAPDFDPFQASSTFPLNAFASAELRQLLRKLLFEQAHADPFREWAVRVYLLEVLLILARSFRTSAPADSNRLRAERIRSYLDMHYFEPIQSRDIADRLGISVRHVNNIFKDTYRITPIQYLTEVRIGRARSLLQDTDKEIITICFEVGYETLPSFYRAFKNIVKTTPHQYRMNTAGARLTE